MENTSASNGTYINDECVMESRPLKHMDILELGGRKFRFELPNPPPAEVRGPAFGKRLCNDVFPSRLTVNCLPLQEKAMVPKEAEVKPFSPANAVASIFTKVSEYVTSPFRSPVPAPAPSTAAAGSENVKPGRRVSWGSRLSPEVYDKSLPPSTPVRRGAKPTPRSHHKRKRLQTPLRQVTCACLVVSSCRPHILPWPLQESVDVNRSFSPAF